MGDTYSRDFEFEPKSTDDMWEICRRFAAAVVKYDPKEQFESTAAKAWRITVDGRAWNRATLKEVRDDAVIPEGARFTVHWNYYGADLQWRLGGQRFALDNARTAYLLSGSGYAGASRMRTEEVIRDVLDALVKRGIEVKVAPTEVSSSDDGTPAAQASITPRPRRRGILSSVKASVKKHVGSYIVGVLILITGGILAALGFKVI